KKCFTQHQPQSSLLTSLFQVNKCSIYHIKCYSSSYCQKEVKPDFQVGFDLTVLITCPHTQVFGGEATAQRIHRRRCYFKQTSHPQSWENRTP
ncbi:hypothetical protein LEMLEM_LOCUS8620, partial [Lemmus lemmus]